MKMKELAILRRMKLLKWRVNKEATMEERGGNDKIILTGKKLYFYIGKKLYFYTVQPSKL